MPRLALTHSPVTKIHPADASRSLPKGEAVDKSGEVTLQTLNSFLICPLCNGYLINAHTLTECSHAFCKSCLWSYSRNSMINDQPLTCPICGTTQQLFHTKPEHGVRPDHLLQNLVYKLVPGLIGAEISRRRKFYGEYLHAKQLEAETNKRKNARLLGSVSLSLEFSDRYSAAASRSSSPIVSQIGDSIAPIGAENGNSIAGGLPKKPASGRIYLLCPSALTVSQLKKFIAVRFSLPLFYEITLLSENDEAMHESLSLGDIAYLIDGNDHVPIRLYFCVTEFKISKRRKTRSSFDRVEGVLPCPVRKTRRKSKDTKVINSKEVERNELSGSDSMSSIEEARHTSIPELSTVPEQKSTASSAHASSYLTSVADPLRPKLLLRRVSTPHLEPLSSPDASDNNNAVTTSES